MKYEDLVEYFESYVSEYKPYKNDKLYTNIVKFLHGYYLKHSYDTIPSGFKTSFEEQNIPVEFYELLLLSNGFPKKLLDTLTFKDKFILLNSLMDYNRYKGTIQALRKTVSIMDDDFNVYELFIDYRDVNIDGSGEEDFQWVFIPQSVYIDEALEDEVLNKHFDFDDIYERADHFFINRDQLNELYERNELVLPIKTNLIMLDQTVIERAFPLLSLFFTIVLNSFRNERLVLYFEDGNYSITLERAYQLWFYILFKRYGIDILFTAPAFAIIFTIDNPITLEYSIEDIDIILEEYNNLPYFDSKAGEKVRLFYKERIEDVFQQFQQTPIQITQEEWTTIFKENLGKGLIEYVNGRMENIEVGSDISRETDKLLNEVYNSIVTWSTISDNPDISKYIHYFLDFLPFLMINPEETSTFKVLNFLKPFHVELIGQGRAVYRVHDKFNVVYADQEFNFIIEMTKASLNQISHKLINKFNYSYYNSQTLINDFYYIINHYMEMLVPIFDEFEPKIIDRRETLADQQHQDIKELTQPMWEYDLEGITTIEQFVSSITSVQVNDEILYEFPVIISISDTTSIVIREESKDLYINTPNMYNFKIGDRGDPKVLQYLETINEIKYYLIFNLMFIKHTMQHSSHEFPQKIKQLKQFDKLYTFIQGDTISKLFKAEPSIVQKFKKYFRSKEYKRSFVKLDSVDFLPTTIIPPKFDNLLPHIEDDSIFIGNAEYLLVQEFMYSITPELPINSIQEFNDRYFYNINSPNNRDFFDIDGYIDSTIRRDTDEELINMLSIYNFDANKISNSINTIRDKYSTEFDPGPMYSNLHMLSWVKQTGMQEYLTLEAIEIYRFDSEISKVTIATISNRMIPFTIMPPKFDNMHIFIDDCTIKYQLTGIIDIEYSYIFDQDIFNLLVFDVSSKYNYNILLNSKFDNLHWFIYNRTGMRVDELIDIDYFYKFSDDWTFLTDVDINHIVSIPQNQPDMIDYLNIAIDNRTGLWGSALVELDYSYLFDQKISNSQVKEILNDEFSFNFQLDSKYDNCHVLSSFTGFSITTDSKFNSNHYFTNLITIRKVMIQQIQHDCNFNQNINKIQQFDFVMKFNNQIGFSGESLFDFDDIKKFLNSIIGSSNQFIWNEKSFNIIDKPRYDTFDTIHHYMSIPVQYGSNEFKSKHEKQFETIMPYISNRYDYWEEAFQIIHQRYYRDGLPIQDDHVLKHAYFEYQIIREFYRFLPVTYTEKTSAELSLNFCIPMWYRCKVDNFHIESNFYQIPIQYGKSKLDFIHEFNFFNFNLIKGTDIEQSYLQWYEVDMSRLDYFHIHGQLHGFSFDKLDYLNIINSNNTIANYQRGSTIDFWYFMVFDWNAIYDSHFNIEHDGWTKHFENINLEIEYYIPFNYSHLGDTNPRFLHYLDWRELHPHPFEIDTELVFTMQPQYINFDIDFFWDIKYDFPKIIIDIDDIIKFKFLDLPHTWVYIISHIEMLKTKKLERSNQEIKIENPVKQIFPKPWVIEIKDQFLIEFVKEDIEHFNITSFGEPIPIQYGSSPLDITYGFKFIDKFRRYMGIYEIDTTEYNFITKLYSQEDNVIVKTIGTPKNRYFEELFIEDYFLPINSEYSKTSIFNIISKVEFINESYTIYDNLNIVSIGTGTPKNRYFEELFIEDYFLPINSEYSKTSIFNIISKVEFINESYTIYDNLNIVSIGTAKNQYWDYPNILDNFNFIESIFKNSLLDIQSDKVFSFFKKDKQTQLKILNDNTFNFDYYFSDLFNRVLFNFNFNFIKEQNTNIAIDSKQNKNINSKNYFDNLDIDTLVNKIPIQLQLEALNIFYNIEFGDYLFEYKIEDYIGDKTDFVISPYIVLDSQSYITNSDLNINKFKEELIGINYDYGQIGYAPEIIENMQEYEEDIEMIISGNSENIEQIEISHNFNTIKI
ncbi:MAG: hypothetical protein H8D97_00765 [Proteobacteria bacterium]|nr:hypothetical protein [Pseudomonadota bacterium]